MYYHTWDSDLKRFVIARAASKDGLQWTKQGPCFSGAPEGVEAAFDALGAASHHIIRDTPSRRCVEVLHQNHDHFWLAPKLQALF